MISVSFHCIIFGVETNQKFSKKGFRNADYTYGT